MRASLLRVVGRAQRVGFRRFALDAAQELGLAGSVRNEADGSVTIVVQGEGRSVERFVARLKNPPPSAAVREIKESKAKSVPRLKSFVIRFGSIPEELQEGFGAVQTEFQDYRKEFKDYRSEFRDYREEFRSFASRTDDSFKHLEEKYGEISEKLTGIMNTLVEESKQTREMLNESLRLLREAVERMPKQG